ncbi:MAG: hypothetical protein KAQ73_01550 [Dehalococcoidia bacterium]|nr:hypothetical protein [Dehalococcoidia bacterium]
MRTSEREALHYAEQELKDFAVLLTLQLTIRFQVKEDICVVYYLSPI